MKLTFVQNDKEKEEIYRVLCARLSHRKTKVGTWILPPNLSNNNKFVVVDSRMEKDVSVKSFDTIDGALICALGIKYDWDYTGSLKGNGSFV